MNQAYDELVALPVEAGYSQQVAVGRAELLDLMRTAVITRKGKTLDAAERQAIIPYDLLPACLALLAEVCHGSACWLCTNSCKPPSVVASCELTPSLLTAAVRGRAGHVPGL